MGFLRGLILGLILIGFGWLGGSLFPAPAAVTEPITSRVPTIAARLGVDDLTIERLQSLMTQEQLARFRREASALAARAGEAIVVDRDPENLQAVMDALPTQPSPAAAPPAAQAGAVAFEAALSLCPAMTVSNAPPSNAQRQVTSYTPLVNVNNVQIARNPTRGACLSSAFGPRGRGQHRGVDYHARDGGPILAAGDGVVIEASYRDDFGNMLLIDHGQGVYTRYAHLSSFSPGVVVGTRVRAGQQIGLMGNTASYPIPIHLHYEILTGDYANPRASFGLTPRSPFS